MSEPPFHGRPSYGRTPPVNEATTRRPHNNRRGGGYHPRTSIDNNTTFHANGADSAMAANEGHSPFLNNLLRFSPKNSGVHHLSPLYQRGGGRDSVTNAGQQQRKSRFFDSTHKTNEVLSNDTEVEMNTTEDEGSLLQDGTCMDGLPVDHVRALAKQTIISSPSMASYYSELLYAKTGLPSDALLLAQSHVAAGRYEACLRIIEEAALLQTQNHSTWEAVLVAAQALLAKKDWTALVEMLEDKCRLPDPNNAAAAAAHNRGTSSASAALPPLSFHALSATQPLEDDDRLGWMALKRSVAIAPKTSLLHPLSLVCWYRGLAYHEMGCGIRATTFWRLALRVDCQCRAAWESLLEKNLLTAHEAYDLIVHDVEFTEHQAWLRSLYLARIELTPQEPCVDTDLALSAGMSKRIDMSLMPTALDASSIQLSSPMPSFQISSGLHATTSKDGGVRESSPPLIQKDVDAAFDDLWHKFKLYDSPQVLAMAARRSYRRYDWKAALRYCQDLAQLDPAVEEAAFCYVATLVILGHKRVLFRLAHEWVEAAPKSAQSWFAVGAYYYCIQRFHIAQRHFCRATRLDPKCTEAWIAFGCSFAACDESDQALASFRAAQRLSPGEHSSLMYIGMEYVRTNHLVLASFFLQASLQASGGDPLCLHELGVLASQKGEYQEAISWYRRALSSIVGGDSFEESILLSHDPYWEPTIFNLGHACRRTGQFDLATSCFSRCAAMCPDKFSAYSAMAYTKHLMGNLDSAISYYHQALALKSDDPFSTEMLNNALKDQISSDSPGARMPKFGRTEEFSSPTGMKSEWGTDDESMYMSPES